MELVRTAAEELKGILGKLIKNSDRILNKAQIRLI